MLALVIADRHLVGVVQEDVGSLKRRVGEQAGGDEVVLAALVLELGHAAEFAVRHIALHDPAEFGVLTNVGLHEQGADLGVEAHGHEHLGESDRAVPHCCSVVVANRDRMEIDHTEEGVGLVLHLCPVPSGAEEVAEVLLARGLDAGEDAGHGPIAYGLTTAARVVCYLPSAALYAARVRSRASAWSTIGSG